MVELTFYYKEGCYLCVQAEDLLNGLIERYDIKAAKINIESDDELFEQYRYDIPVIEFKDGSALHGNIRKKDLVEKLEENRE